MHRGNATKGIAAPNFKHGRYSKSLPLRLAARYQEALADPDLLSVRSETALLVSRLEEQLGQLDRGESGALWDDLRRARQDLIAAKAAGNTMEQAVALNEILVLIDRGAREQDQWREIRSTIQDRTRVAESERKRLVEMHQVITIERMLVLVGALSSAILEEIPDRALCARLLDRFDRALSVGASAPDA